MSDQFLDLFSAEYDVVYEGANAKFTVSLDIDKVVADIIVSDELLSEAKNKEVGQLIIERIILDLTEGVTEALNKIEPDMFPSFLEYDEHQQMKTD